MKRSRKITQQKLKALLDYDLLTGIFTWRSRLTGYRGWDVRYTKSWNGQNAGKPAGTLKDGYVQISVDRVLYRAHHLAFLWMTGRMPAMVDHEDLNRSNNRWNNLREATYTQNFANTRRRSDNSSGYKGVSRAMSGRWRARINVEGKSTLIGVFDTPELAAAAYAAAAVQHFGAFARP